jgi:hypothetical protein
VNDATNQYKADYNRGWRTSRNAGEHSLENADARNEPNSWYDGYLDYAAGRPKWTLMHDRAAQ